MLLLNRVKQVAVSDALKESFFGQQKLIVSLSAGSDVSFNITLRALRLHSDLCVRRKATQKTQSTASTQRKSKLYEVLDWCANITTEIT